MTNKYLIHKNHIVNFPDSGTYIVPFIAKFSSPLKIPGCTSNIVVVYEICCELINLQKLADCILCFSDICDSKRESILAIFETENYIELQFLF